ncbi:MAG: hypothetical protein RLZZ517_216 [Candidatus Parcubacteria bacterium]
MKNFIKNISLIFVLGLVFTSPINVSADSYSDYDSYYGNYDYSYDSYYGNYDNSYDSYYGNYDYSYYPSYGNYSGYSSDYSNYGADYYGAYNDYYGGYNDYAYNYDYGYNDYYGGCGSYDCGGYYGGCGSNCGSNNNYESLTVYCTVSDTSIEEGDSVTFTAYAEGGKGKYTYSWSGAGLAGKTSKSVSSVFNSEGTYYGKVKVTDNKGNTATANCAGVHVEAERQIYNPIDVTCSVSDRNIEDGDEVTYTADAEGGRGSYTYRWYGDASGSSRSITEEYNNSGTYYAYVRVTDQDGRSATANCDSVRVDDNNNDDEDFDVTCKVSDTSIEEGDTVRFTAEVDGGDSPFDYDWSGDLDDDRRTFTAKFNSDGRYEVELRVRDDEGRVARDTCPIVRVDNDDNDDNDRDVNVTTGNLSSGNGTYSGVSSVYLNQIPYTGPEDVAKGIAFVVGILAWSIAAALIIRNRMNKHAVSNRIAAFKEANKSSQI